MLATARSAGALVGCKQELGASSLTANVISAKCSVPRCRTANGMLVRRAIRSSSVARDAGGRGRGPAAFVFTPASSARSCAPSGPSGRAGPRRSVLPRHWDARAAPVGMPADHPPPKVFVLGAPWRLMHSLQLQGRSAYAGVGAERRRPCRLQAVIRRLAAHGQRDARFRSWTLAAAPPTGCSCAARSDRRAWRAMLEGAAAGLRRSS
jgi:hypothetical protein